MNKTLCALTLCLIISTPALSAADTITPQNDINTSEKEDYIVVLRRDIEHLEWDLVALEHQLDQFRAHGRIIQTNESRIFTIGDAGRFFEQSCKTRAALQNKRKQLEELLNNQ